MGRYKKKIILIFFFLCLFFLGAVTPTLAKGRSQEKLPQLIHVLQHNGATITNWSLYARKQQTTLVSLTQVSKEASALKASYSHFHWSTKNEPMDIRYVGASIDNKDHIKESIILLAYPRKNAYQTYTIYVVSGSKWDEETWSKYVSAKVEQNVNELFGGSSPLFACASGNFSDKMNVVLSEKTNAILNELKATQFEADQEQTFTSVSAYTALWNQTIQSNGHQINVQLGIRKLPNETTVTLGTPIITSEY